MPFGANFTTQYSYLVDQSGDQVTELDNSGYFLHSNIWIAGGLEATYDKTALHFNFEDPVGTKRAQGNVLGQLDETCVSLPFGNDINDPYGVNCTAASNGLHTGDDDGEIHFSQKERDTETGNDYFLARYYNSAWGRFITPDWSVKVEPVPYAAFTDPQSLNLYAYVRNSPLIRIDPDGHCDGFECQMQQDWIAQHQITNLTNQQVANAGLVRIGAQGQQLNSDKPAPQSASRPAPNSAPPVVPLAGVLPPAADAAAQAAKQAAKGMPKPTPNPIPRPVPGPDPVPPEFRLPPGEWGPPPPGFTWRTLGWVIGKFFQGIGNQGSDFILCASCQKQQQEMQRQHDIFCGKNNPDCSAELLQEWPNSQEELKGPRRA